MHSLEQVVSKFGKSAKQKLDGPGQREALISGPVAHLLEELGALMDASVVAHNEVKELDGAVRPDFGVRVDGLLCGYVELKAPGESLDPSTYGKTTHNYRQWQRLKELPNLLHTNGLEWRLWRYGELVDDPVHLHGASLQSAGISLTAPGRFELILNSFLQWSPAPIQTVAKLVETLAPLARMLKEEVRLALKSERRAVKSGKPLVEQPFLGVATDWRAYLFPQATDEQFADGYAQTVTFALLLAVSEGVDVRDQTLHDVSTALEASHSLMARALNLLTEHIKHSPAWTGIEMLTRVIGAVDWERIARSSKEDLYLHLYEHFLSEYDPARRRASGSYYTPVEVVDGMTRLTESALKTFLGKSQGFRSPSVSIVDPAMGTGTYPLSIIRRVAADAAKQYGPGAAPEAISNVAERLYGLELQSAAFSVAELRIASALRQSGAESPQDGLRLYVADTLEDPSSGSNQQLSYTLQLIAKQRRLANKMKRERSIQVCIGNPPYADHAGGQGGWIESGTDPRTGLAPLDAFRLHGNGLQERHLSNLYVYFWRWSFWKVFESTLDLGGPQEDAGAVCLITATGYLAGPGFKGMRKYIREKCSRGWIINLTPEGKQPPAKSAVFNIETPVAIGLFLREADTPTQEPALIKYVDLWGTTAEKFEKLAVLTLESDEWRDVRPGWTDTFIPPSGEQWDSFPRMDELFPWKAAGIMAGHAYVYAPSASVLEERLRSLVNETDDRKKSEMFHEGRDSSLDKVKRPLYGSDTEKNTNKPFRSTVMVTDPAIVPVGFRAFDRQWIIADSRLLIQPSPDLWWARAAKDQIFAVELHSEFPRSGPGVVFSSLIPDAHYFRGSGGGRTLPFRHPDGSINVAKGLSKALGDLIDGVTSVPPEEVIAYVAGVTSYRNFVEFFADDLRDPGVHVPLTCNGNLWKRAVQIGRDVLWLHSFGEHGKHSSGAPSVVEVESVEQPKYVSSVKSIPESFRFDADHETLHVGSGSWSGVTSEMWSYTVGGTRVIESWVGYRLKKPKGKKVSPLDRMSAQSWSHNWSVELSEMLSVLKQLIELEPTQGEILADIVVGQTLSRTTLAEAGVAIPPDRNDTKPRKPSTKDMLY